MSVHVRTMQLADISAIERIQADAYSNYFLESVEVISQRFNLSPSTAWVVEREGFVCAYLVAYWSQVGKINPLHAPFTLIENPNCLYLHDLAIASSAQGLGISKLLCNAALICAQEKHVKAIALLSVQNSKRFWEGMGFVEYSALDNKQKHNVERYVDGKNPAVYMLKTL